MCLELLADRLIDAVSGSLASDRGQLYGAEAFLLLPTPPRKHKKEPQVVATKAELEQVMLPASKAAMIGTTEMSKFSMLHLNLRTSICFESRRISSLLLGVLI